MKYDLFLGRDYLVFSCAHFVIGEKIKEPLHGHNYKVTIHAYGSQAKDNMVIDFHILKRILIPVIEKLDHHVLIPAKNKYIQIEEQGEQVIIKIPIDKKEYEFPKTDLVILPIENSTVEEIIHYIANQLADNEQLQRDNIDRVSITLFEYENQGVTLEFSPNRY
ncbi:MAG: 6-pyruvoyl trahydropterin synthase family protein [Candidatus Heimdallarchaeaceae archaeon]